MAPISEREEKEIEEIFRKYDRDDSNSLSVEEVVRMVKKMGWNMNVPDEQIKQWFQSVDTDGAAGISLEEFKKAYGSQLLEDRRGARLRRVFASYDTDDSGYLSPGELHKGLTDLKIDMSLEECENFVQSFTNKDGKYPITEFVEFYRKCSEIE